MNWTCEGLKLIKAFETTIGRETCELNLWGIETIFIINALHDARNRCELNLWGIETLGWKVSSRTGTHVWIEPVRDWNNIRKAVVWIGKIGVNWTCEGLKPGLRRNFLKYLLQCELNLWGIETYVIYHIPTTILYVWIEPVRDWNNFQPKYKIPLI